MKAIEIQTARGRIVTFGTGLAIKGRELTDRQLAFEDKKREVKALFQQGKTRKEIEALTGYSEFAIYRALKAK